MKYYVKSRIGDEGDLYIMVKKLKGQRNVLGDWVDWNPRKTLQKRMNKCARRLLERVETVDKFNSEFT